MPQHAAHNYDTMLMPQVAPYGDIRALGTAAVANEAAAAQAGLMAEAQIDPHLRDIAARHTEQHLGVVHGQLADTRAVLRSLNPGQKAEIEQYLTIHLGQPDRRHLGHRTLTDWLADPFRGATDDEVFGFLESHVRYVAGIQQSPAVHAADKRIRLTYLGAQDQAVRNRHFSPHAHRTAHRAMTTKLVTGDIFDTIVSQNEFLGYHWHGSDYMVVAQAYGRNADTQDPDAEFIARMEIVVPHELDHVQDFGRWEARWLKEGTAEHNNLSLRDGAFIGFDPQERGERDSGTYAPERVLISVLNTEGLEYVDPDFVTRAHTSAGLESQEWHALMERWDRAWNTPNVYGVVSRNLHELEGRLRANHQDWSPRQCQVEALRTITADVRRYMSRVKTAHSRYVTAA